MDEPSPLPAMIANLLTNLDAPPRLIAHLRLVHATACATVTALDARWPSLNYDREAVRFGAATHDIGKIKHPNELTGPGHEHEAAGVALLCAHGIPEWLARFAQTHERWDASATLEDLLVALADHWWRGKRAERLEALVCRQIAQQIGAPDWQVFMTLDDIAADVTHDANLRLQWQNLHWL